MSLVKAARDALIDKKAENVVLMDVRNISSVADYFLIATASNNRHIKALGEEIGRIVKSNGAKIYRTSGAVDSGWVIYDFMDFVVHVFMSDIREHYTLETLWKDAAIIE